MYAVSGRLHEFAAEQLELLPPSLWVRAARILSPRRSSGPTVAVEARRPRTRGDVHHADEHADDHQLKPGGLAARRCRRLAARRARRRAATASQEGEDGARRTAETAAAGLLATPLAASCSPRAAEARGFTLLIGFLKRGGTTILASPRARGCAPPHGLLNE